jgi:hypothetical protein
MRIVFKCFKSFFAESASTRTTIITEAAKPKYPSRTNDILTISEAKKFGGIKSIEKKAIRPRKPPTRAKGIPIFKYVKFTFYNFLTCLHT